MVCIAVSFSVMIFALAISSGFRWELRKAVSEISGDILITNPDLNYLTQDAPLDYDEVRTRIEGISALRAMSPVVYRAGIVKNNGEIAGVVFKGSPDHEDSLRVDIPSRLSEMLSLKVGDPLTAYFVGEKIKARKFTVSGVYPTVLSGDDKLVIYAGLSDMRRLNGWNASEASAVEILLDDPDQMEAMTDEVGTALTLSEDDMRAPVAQSAQHRFPQIFSWLDLIDVNVMFVLILMTIVAAFNMVSGLLIMLFRNISTIGILKSMGMTDRNIAEVFLKVASGIVLKGLLVGNAFALSLCVLQGRTHLFRLDPENYFISFVPVHLNPLGLLAADLLSYLAIMAVLLLPSLFVSKVDPAKTVRVQ